MAATRRFFVSLLFFFLLAGSLFLCGQQPEASQIPTLRQMTRQAGYIFVGRVSTIDFVAPPSGEMATARVTFQVEQGLRGVRSGGSLSIREWAGLWGGKARYRVGERLLLFLYPQSRLGLTSTVGGAQGKFAVNRDGLVVVSTEQQLLLSRERLGGGLMPGRVRLPDLRRMIRGSVAERSER